ncbi:hypothetical protein U1737_09600 [Sphingomonas sp. LB3N6]|uniref:hypothetical protein n=1 Tax=Sphingomonas fucosidasi TaxID=3096164 RepID=UPI002FCB77A6
MTDRSFKFAAPGWTGKDQRNSVRIVVDWGASVAVEKVGSCAVKVTDCTTRGCRIETDLGVAVGTFIRIAIPSFTDVQGWVAWSSPEAIGVDFSHPLPGKVLEYIIEQNDPF